MRHKKAPDREVPVGGFFCMHGSGLAGGVRGREAGALLGVGAAGG